MKKIYYFLLLTTLSFGKIHAQEIDSMQMLIQVIENSLTYQTGKIELESGNATLNVPQGFKFLDRTQSINVLTNYWGNPADSSILGMLIPENSGVLGDSSWAFTISFDEMGYVKDDDADDINYDDLLKEQQEETNNANPERVKEGYEPITFVGWASAPYYDKDKKILHWAKELKFGEGNVPSTLNYNLRILGRKGIFLVNAVAGINQLNEVKSNVDKVTAGFEFKDGHKYSDYVTDVDEVAALTVGGLVAGKVLAKVGFFALLAKFWKLIALAVVGAASALWKFLKREKSTEPISVDTESSKENTEG